MAQTPLKKVLTLLDRRQRRSLALLFVMMVLGAGFEVLGVGLIMPLIDSIANSTGDSRSGYLVYLRETLGLEPGRPVVGAIVVLMLGAFAAKGAFLVLLAHLKYRFAQRGYARLASGLVRGYLHSDYLDLSSRNSAELVRNVANSASYVFNTIVIAYLSIATEIAVIAAVVGLLLAVSGLTAILAFLILAGAGGALALTLRPMIARWGERFHALQFALIKAMNESFAMAKTIKALGREAHFIDRFEAEVGELARYNQFFSVVNELPRHILELLMVAGMLAVTLLLLGRAPDGSGVLPILGLFAMAAFRLMPSVQRLIGYYNTVKYGHAQLDAVYEDVVRMRARRPAPEGAAGELSFDAELHVEEVSLHYPGRKIAALEEVSLTVRPGESIGLVGASGAGKTSLADCILGLIAPTGGRVRADGHDIFDHLPAWRRLVGYVPQDVVLFDDTIRRNIALGLTDEAIDETAVEAAARAAALDDVLGSLPDGLDTVVGERGVRLSGGQRQRIGIARALYAAPRVLVLDEATSALDSETEWEIAQAVERLRGRTTVIVIAHRLSTVRRCDRLAFMQAGRISDVASFDELLNRNPEFRRMAERGNLFEHAPAAQEARVSEAGS